MVDKKREMLQVMLAHQLHFAKTQVLVSWIPWIEESFACQVRPRTLPAPPTQTPGRH